MTKDEALKLALEALKANDLLINGTEKAGGLAWCIDGYYSDCFDIDPINEQTERAITAIREALAQPEQNEFNPDWDAMAVMVEEQQRMAKRIAELEAQQEPVAWLHTKIEGVAVPHRPADLDKHPDRWEALYKTPPPCPTCEALARTVMLDQTYHDAHRNPLTDEQLLVLLSKIDEHAVRLPRGLRDFARAIEAAHGIKE